MKGSSSAIGYFQAWQQRVTMYTKTKKNVARCRDSRTAKAGKQGKGSSIKQFSIQPLYTSFTLKIWWGCILSCFVAAGMVALILTTSFLTLYFLKGSWAMGGWGICS